MVAVLLGRQGVSSSCLTPTNRAGGKVSWVHVSSSYCNCETKVRPVEIRQSDHFKMKHNSDSKSMKGRMTKRKEKNF
eukprot:1710600-Amphidinium_carterae.2